jgi:hypothetical protein
VSEGTFPLYQPKDLTLVGMLFIVVTEGFNGPIVFCSQSVFDSNKTSLLCKEMLKNGKP